MLLRNFLNDFQMVPAPLIITGITFTFHMRCYFFCKVDYLLLLLFYFIFVKKTYYICTDHVHVIFALFITSKLCISATFVPVHSEQHSIHGV